MYTISHKVDKNESCNNNFFFKSVIDNYIGLVKYDIKFHLFIL